MPPDGMGLPSASATRMPTPSSARPSVFDDFSAARDGSVRLVDKDSVIPKSEHTVSRSSLAARSIRTGGIGAPPHRKERSRSGRGEPSATALQMSARNGDDAAV